MRKALWLLLLSLLIVDNLIAQTHTLNGVYGGMQFSVSPLVGGGMTRRDIVILFRPDGTFNSELDKPDWKTRISGRYQINGSNVTVNYARGHDEFTIQNNGYLHGSGFTLFKLSGLTIPPGYYEMKRISNSGGMGTGLIAVGASSNSGLIFDGKGHFSNSKSSVAIISGDNVGGGTTKSSSGSGDYKIDHGMLTLTYSDGKIETHSFFCQPDDKKPMAAIDGGIYFMEDNNDNRPAKTTNTTNGPGKATSTVATNTTGNTEAKALLLKANSTHGGNHLDMIKTLRYSATIMGIKAVSYVDIPDNRIRIELWENGKMISAEQEENGDGWQWLNGRKAVMPAARIAEMKSTFYSGLLGLRKPAINQMQVVSVQKLKNNNTYSVLCKLDGNDYIFAINDQNQLVAEANKTSGRTSVSVLSDLHPVQGIMIPFHEEVTTGIKKLVIQYDNFEINPVFNNDIWAVPAGM